MDILGFTGEQFTRLLAIMGDPILRKLFLCYCGMAIAGEITYACVLWFRKEIDCVWHRFQSDPRTTILAIGTNALAVLIVALTPDIIVPTLTLSAALFNGFMQGIGLDAALNRSSRKVLTDEQRAALQAKKTPAT